MAQNTGMYMADREFELCVQTGFTKLFFFFKKDVYGERSRWGEEKHHMKLPEKTEGSICCDMKTITLRKAKHNCWLKEALNAKL